MPCSIPKDFPDGPINTLTKELGYLLGVPIYYYAAINLDGFKQMVDLVGGVTVTYDQDIFDPSYAWEDGGPAWVRLPCRDPPPRRSDRARVRSIAKGRQRFRAGGAPADLADRASARS